MKKMLIVSFIVVALITSGITAALASTVEMDQAQPHIKCCFQDGQCLETRKDNCALKKGIVVQECKDCPGVWGKSKEK